MQTQPNARTHTRAQREKMRRRRRMFRLLYRFLIVVAVVALIFWVFHACSGGGVGRLSHVVQPEEYFTAKEQSGENCRVFYPETGVPAIDADIASMLPELTASASATGGDYAGVDYAAYKWGANLLSLAFTVTGYQKDAVCSQQVRTVLYRTTDGVRLQPSAVFTPEFYTYASQRVRGLLATQVSADRRESFMQATEPTEDHFSAVTFDDSGCTLYIGSELVDGTAGVRTLAIPHAEIDGMLLIEPDGTAKTTTTTEPPTTTTAATTQQVIEGDGKQYPPVKPAYSNADPSKPMVCLTYDDGPGPYTSQLLDILEKYGARATFFVQGCNARNYPDEIKRMVSLGCQIGNHTMSHNDLTSQSDADVLSAVESTNDIIESICGVRPYILRPPYGSYNDRVGELLEDYPFILWDIDTLDWKTRDTQATIDSAVGGAKDRMIILMHDIHQPTVAAAESIVSTLTQQGYQLVTIEELAYYTNRTMVGGQRNL